MMKAPIGWFRTSGIVTVLLVTAFCSCFGQDAPADVLVSGSAKSAEANCLDEIAGKVVIDAELHSDFFKATTTQYPWYIIVHADGHLEDATDGTIDAEDRVQIEHTANCVSTHQGKHAMKFCDATLDGDGKLVLHISGGLPAYASLLDIEVDDESKVKCAFSAVYPAPTGPLIWRITKKDVRFSSADTTAGSRLHGWISVDFEEGEIVDDEEKWGRTYKIEGFIKPVVIKE